MTTGSTFGRIRGMVAGPTPGYFALGMASGIISLGMRQQGLIALSVLLLAVCALSFAALVILNLRRMVVGVPA